MHGWCLQRRALVQRYASLRRGNGERGATKQRTAVTRASPSIQMLFFFFLLRPAPPRRSCEIVPRKKRGGTAAFGAAARRTGLQRRAERHWSVFQAAWRALSRLCLLLCALTLAFSSSAPQRASVGPTSRPSGSAATGFFHWTQKGTFASPRGQSAVALLEGCRVVVLRCLLRPPRHARDQNRRNNAPCHTAHAPFPSLRAAVGVCEGRVVPTRR